MTDSISIYGILNVTPDSFSDGGMFNDADEAVRHALKMISDGADVIDIGGMSTRPGYDNISAEEELSRVIPVIKKIRAVSSCRISLDTFRAGVAARAIEAGADIINDISGLSDPDMAPLIASAGVEAVLMRNGLDGAHVPWEETIGQTVDRAKACGISDDKIILDPGVGFTDSRETDIELIRAIPAIKQRWGYPVLLGVSRKRITSVFYNGDSLPKERDGASVALALYGMSIGADALRVHNVKQTYAAVRAFKHMTDG